MPKTKGSSTLLQNELLTRAVTDVVPRELAKAKLASGKKLRVYLGIDPTGAKLHLGHAIPLRKLRAFQEAGHHAILVIGSFTAMIGDPTGREVAREPLTRAQVENNFKTYKKQAGLILDFKKVEIRYNHEWLERLTAADIMKISSHFTVQQMMQRDMFRDRMSWKVICTHCQHQFNSPIQFKDEESFRSAQLEGNAVRCPYCGQVTPCNKENIIPPPNPVTPNEFLYPIMVGYDSVVLDVDCEIGGNDQLFNMLCGRKLQKAYGKRDKFVLTTKILEGTDGRKMSKTYDNCIYLTDSPGEMYGKVMSIGDELIMPYFEACTNVPLEDIAAAAKALALHANPKPHKEYLAKEIVTLYHGKTAAAKAADEFYRVHKEGKLPSDMPTVKIPAGKTSMPILDLLVYAKLAPSKAEARRLVTQGGVKVGGKVEKDWQASVSFKAGPTIQVGSRRFVRLV